MPLHSLVCRPAILKVAVVACFLPVPYRKIRPLSDTREPWLAPFGSRFPRHLSLFLSTVAGPFAPQDGGGREGCQRGFRPRCRRRVRRSAVLRPNDRQALLVGHNVLRSCFRQGRTYAAPSLSAALARRHNRFSSIIARTLNHPSIRRELASFAPLQIGFF